MDYIAQFMEDHSIQIGQRFAIDGSPKYKPDNAIFYISEEYQLKDEVRNIIHTSTMLQLLAGKYTIVDHPRRDIKDEDAERIAQCVYNTMQNDIQELKNVIWNAQSSVSSSIDNDGSRTRSSIRSIESQLYSMEGQVRSLRR